MELETVAWNNATEIDARCELYVIWILLLMKQALRE